ncbi:MAG: DUF202 domain-containing protein [Nitriliruptorales bacterium]|nr:DUF202 domain-containing protein [Nitriliruptorales bacterium]
MGPLVLGRRWWSLTPRRDVGHDPDYRFSFANERTFLAWIRTALALVGGGLVVAQLLPDLSPGWARQALGALLVFLGLALAATSVVRWARNEDAMRNDLPLPPPKLPVFMAVGVGVVSAVAVFLLVFGGAR